MGGLCLHGHVRRIDSFATRRGHNRCLEVTIHLSTHHVHTPIATGGHPADPIDPPTDPVSTLQGNPHVNPITPVATQHVVPDNRDRHVGPIAPISNHRQPPMISVRQPCDSI